MYKRQDGIIRLPIKLACSRTYMTTIHNVNIKWPRWVTQHTHNDVYKYILHMHVVRGEIMCRWLTICILLHMNQHNIPTCVQTTVSIHTHCLRTILNPLLFQPQAHTSSMMASFGVFKEWNCPLLQRMFIVYNTLIDRFARIQLWHRKLRGWKWCWTNRAVCYADHMLHEILLNYSNSMSAAHAMNMFYYSLVGMYRVVECSSGICAYIFLHFLRIFSSHRALNGIIHFIVTTAQLLNWTWSTRHHNKGHKLYKKAL